MKIRKRMKRKLVNPKMRKAMNMAKLKKFINSLDKVYSGLSKLFGVESLCFNKDMDKLFKEFEDFRDVIHQYSSHLGI